MKRILLSGLSAGMVALMFSSASTGPAANGLGNRTGSQGSIPSCSGGGCHGGPSTTLMTTLAVLDANNTPVTSYIPGATYKIIVGGTNTASGQPQFGFQATAVRKSAPSQQAGTFNATGNIGVRTNITPNVVEHNTKLNGTTVGGNTAYAAQFNWVAPAAGTGIVQFFAIVNAVSGMNGADAADRFKQLDMPVELTEAPSSSVATVKRSALSFYPNPASTELNLRLPAIHSSAAVMIIDAAGRVVSLESHSLQAGKATLSTAHLTPGNYYMSVQADETVYSAPFVKQ